MNRKMSRKKKIGLLTAAVVIAVIILVLNVGRSPYNLESLNNYDGLYMYVVEDTVTPAGLTLEFINKTDKDFIYGSDYSIERQKFGRWYTVKTVVLGGFNDIGYRVNRDSSWEVDWEWLYGQLPPGKYRIIKDVFERVDRPVTEEDHFYLAAYFTVSEESQSVNEPEVEIIDENAKTYDVSLEVHELYDEIDKDAALYVMTIPLPQTEYNAGYKDTLCLYYFKEESLKDDVEFFLYPEFSNGRCASEKYVINPEFDVAGSGGAFGPIVSGPLFHLADKTSAETPVYLYNDPVEGVVYGIIGETAYLLIDETSRPPETVTFGALRNMEQAVVYEVHADGTFKQIS